MVALAEAPISLSAGGGNSAKVEPLTSAAFQGMTFNVATSFADRTTLQGVGHANLAPSSPAGVAAELDQRLRELNHVGFTIIPVETLIPPDKASAILTAGGYADIEVHRWQFGGRES